MAASNETSISLILLGVKIIIVAKRFKQNYTSFIDNNYLSHDGTIPPKIKIKALEFLEWDYF